MGGGLGTYSPFPPCGVGMGILLSVISSLSPPVVWVRGSFCGWVDGWGSWDSLSLSLLWCGISVLSPPYGMGDYFF